MKIFIACSKWSYKYVSKIEKQLKLMGHEVVLPSYIEDTIKENEIKELSYDERVIFYKKSSIELQKKAIESDCILVLNFDKNKDGKIYKNYIGGITFLEMYDSYILDHPIYLYNEIPIGMLYDEIEGMGSIVINGDLFKLEKDYVKFEKNNLRKYFNLDELKYIESLDPYCKAQAIINIVFKDKRDKSGQPYIGHLYRVSGSLKNYNEKVAGLLHDIVEDTEITCKDLLEIGFPLEVVEIINLVTKKQVSEELTKEERLKLYNDEIDRIIDSKNMQAIRLKIADISDNSDINRISKLSEEKQTWFNEKYTKQLVKLKKIEGMR